MKIFIEPYFRKIYEQYPLVLVDIGASGGFAPNWQPALKYLNVIGFEPDEREYHNLALKSGQRVRYLNAALGRNQGLVDFYLTRKQQTSSVFKPHRAFLDQFPEASRFDIVETVKLKVDTLDHQCESQKINNVDFIKMDCQGSELAIMQGASQMIKDQVIGIEVEVEYDQIYEGQPLFADVDVYLRTQGFYLFDLKNYFWKRTSGESLGSQRGQLVAADALYFRTVDSLALLIDGLKSKEDKRAKILKTLSVAALYGYYDYAAAVYVHLKDHFEGKEQNEIELWLKQSKGFCYFLPSFRGRRMLSKIFYRISEFFRVTHNGWAVMDRELGNRQ